MGKKTQQKDDSESSDLEMPVKKEKVVVEEVPFENLQIFVSGIPYEATETMLRDFFNQAEDKTLANQIVDIKLPLY